MYTLLLFLILVDAALLTTAILLQAGTGGGLAALGGGGGTDSLLGGRQATTILTKLTWYGGAMFLTLAFVLQLISSRSGGPASVLENQIQLPTPVRAAPLPFDDPQGAEAVPPQPTEQPTQPEDRDR